MLKSSIASFALIVALSAPSAHADIWLGELLGNLSLTTSLVDQNGNETKTQGTCETALNLSLTNTSVGYEFSYYNCGGINLFNDAPFTFAIRDGVIYNEQNVQIGAVDSNGQATFTITSRPRHVRQQTSIGCGFFGPRVVTREFDLHRSVTFTMKKLANGSYSFSRNDQHESVYPVQKRDSTCAGSGNYIDYALATNKAVISGVVSPR